MGDAQKAPVDLDSLSAEEREHYEKFGMLPKKKSLASQMLEKRREGRQQFDSADWAKNLQAGKKGPMGKLQKEGA